jgi:indolepyruvate ferredoxin oxidoreductase beta subunit
MKFDTVVAGVGGQGILSISFVVDNAALEQGLSFKQSEVHGMAQRGGAVVSHLRVSDSDIFSDLIPMGTADLILSMEPLEALRYLDYLSPGGTVVASVNPFVNIPDYPDEEKVLDRILKLSRHTVINASELARAAGSHFAQNIVMLGAASHLMPLKPESLEKFIGVLFRAKGEKVIETNINAFRAGALAGSLYRDLLNEGLAPADAAVICTRLEARQYAREDIAGWAELCGRDGAGNFRKWIRSRKGLILGDAETRGRLEALDFSSAEHEDFEAAAGSA